MCMAKSSSALRLAQFAIKPGVSMGWEPISEVFRLGKWQLGQEFEVQGRVRGRTLALLGAAH